jgi:ferric-dicitrate binding protein FerR (iron transport regulator)
LVRIAHCNLGEMLEEKLAERHEPAGRGHRLVRRSLVRLLGFGLVALSVTPRKSWAREVAGSVEEIKGEAFAEAQNERRKLENAAPLFIADEVSTGAASRLALHLGKDTTVRLGELAHLIIDRFIENAGGELTLASGPLLFDRQAGAEPRPLRIRSSYGLIAVRGTRFFAGPSNGVFGVFVERGSVVVSAAGQEVTLGAGEGTNIAHPGDAPTPPAPWKQPRIDAAMASIL